MRYASVCSGVEAASLAWMPLGWEPVWFSEIDPFPCEVLKHRFPNVPNMGDMTKIHYDKERQETYADGTDVVVRGGIDLLVGGTPCQSFSVAGNRKGLGGASGLAYHFIRLLEEISPEWFVWENVPGCLSSVTGGRRDFNFLMRAYAECGYGVAWRVLDVQYTRVDGFPRAIPQRRRRVFAVGHHGDNLAAEVLFEQRSVLGDTPPCRKKREELAIRAEGCAGISNPILGFHEASFGNYRREEAGGVIKASGGYAGGGVKVLSAQTASMHKGVNNQNPIAVEVYYP